MDGEARTDRFAVLVAAAEAMLDRADSYLTRERVEEFLRRGEWEATSFVDLLVENARLRGSQPAVIEADGAEITWQGLLERALSFKDLLARLGYQRGDMLGVQLPNWAEFLWVVLGAAWSGVRPVFIHVPYRAYEMSYILGLTQAKGVVVPRSYRGFDHVALAKQVAREVPSLQDVIVANHTTSQGRLPEPNAEASEEALRIVSLDRDPSGTRLPDESDEASIPPATDLFVVMFTSGTTNRPKGVMHLHANLLNACRKYVEAFSLSPSDRWLVVTPLTHLTAFGISFLTGGMAAGSSLVLLESWEVEKALELAEAHRVTHVVGAPPMLIDMARSQGLAERDLASLRFMMYAGAPCPVEILKRLHDKLGCSLAVFYGWTEGLAHTYTVPEDPLEVTSVTIGRTGSGWESRVVDDEGKEVGFGAQGEFWGRGANLSPGYYHQAEFMPARFNSDGWFMSGDLVTKNEDGTFTFVARKDDVINRGGQKVDPREVEELLYQMDEIRDAVVVAAPDERLGNRGCAFVVLVPGMHLNLQDIQRFLEQKGLAKYKWPERLEIVDSLPMTPTGKIMRYALRRRASEIQ